MNIMKNIHNIVSDMQERFPDYVIILHQRSVNNVWSVEVVKELQVLQIDILIDTQENRVIPVSIVNDFRSNVFIEIVSWLMAAF
jgi:hypothetical protein